MKITIDFIKNRFNTFNRTYFENTLPEPTFKLVNVRTYMGQMGRREYIRGPFRGKVEYILKINTRFEMDEAAMEDIVLHEMIHYYIMVKGIRDTSSHGRVFRQWMTLLNQRFGRHISITSPAHNGMENTNQPQKAKPVCLCHLKDGEVGIMVPAFSRIHPLENLIRRTSEIVSTHWYVTEHPYFNRFPRSRTLKVYKIDTKEVLPLLADCQEIKALNKKNNKLFCISHGLV